MNSIACYLKNTDVTQCQTQKWYNNIVFMYAHLQFKNGTLFVMLRSAIIFLFFLQMLRFMCYNAIVAITGIQELQPHPFQGIETPF